MALSSQAVVFPSFHLTTFIWAAKQAANRGMKPKATPVSKYVNVTSGGERRRILQTPAAVCPRCDVEAMYNRGD